jgi:hypothetical protein
MAAKKTVLRQKLNAFIGAVRAWLRAHGFAQLAEYGNTDLAHLLATARKSLAAKATGCAGRAMPVFARNTQNAVIFTGDELSGKNQRQHHLLDRRHAERYRKRR